MSAQHTPGRILNTSQAVAVYSAICALNNVSMSQFRTAFPGPAGRDGRGTSHIYIEASELAGKWPFKVSIYSELNIEDNYSETYADQNAFAAAYDLHTPSGGMTC